MLVAIVAAVAAGLLIETQQDAPATPGHDPAPAPAAPAQAAPQSRAAPEPEPANRAAAEPAPKAPERTTADSRPASANPSTVENEGVPAARAGTPPPARVEPMVFDFGIKHPNELIWTNFKVKNPTNQTLVIREVKPACKCTVPTLDSKIIPPGGEINLDASLDLRGYLGDAKKNFHIFFEGYAVPIECVISGVLSYPVQITPHKPSISALPRDLSGQLYLKSIESRPFRVCAVNGTAPVVLHKNSQGETATEWRIQYQLDQALTREKLPFMLLVETDHPGAEMLDLKIGGTVNSQREMQWLKLWNDIFVNRNNVNLGIIPKGGYSDFETSIMRPDHASPCEVSFASRMFSGLPAVPSAAKNGEIAAEIIRIEPVDGRASEEMYTVRVTNLSDENKVIQQPLYFHSGEVESRLWIGARLVPNAGDEPCAAN
jgi:hypothetical protein